MINLFNNKTQNLQPLSSKVTQHTFDFTDNSKLNPDMVNQITEKVGETRHYPPANQEWVDSAYSYNKNYTKTLPVADSLVNRLIKSYFSMTPLQNGKKSKRVQIRFRRLSLNRMLVSKAEMKHTNNKVTITVYIYNKNRKFLYYKLKNLYKTIVMNMPTINLNAINNRKKSFVSSLRKSAVFGRKTKNTLITQKNLSRISGTKTNNSKNSAFALRNNKTIFVSIFNKSVNKPSALASASALNKKKFSTKRFKTSNKRVISPLHQKINNTSNFYNVTKSKLTKFLHKIKSPDLKNKYKTLINKYYTILNDYDFSSTGQYYNYYSNFTSMANPSFNDSKYSTSSFYKFLSKTPKSLSLNTKKSSILFISKAFKLRNKLSKTRKIKNLMYKLRSVYKLFGFDNIYNYNTFGLKNVNISNLDENSLSNNLYKVLDKSLASKAKKKINFVFVKATRIIKKARRHKNFLFRTLKWSNESFANYEEKYFNKYLKKAFAKEIMYLYYVKMLSINNNKFKNWFILGLKKVISKIYNKTIVFNFVNLKYLHLNSDIFTESIATKLRNRQNRLLRVLKKALHLVKLPRSNRVFLNRARKEKVYKTLLNKYKTLAPWREVSSLNLNSAFAFKTNDTLNGLFVDVFPESNENINNITRGSATHKLSSQAENVLNSTKHKAVFGVRLEAAGRLSKRLTASRSVFKLKYKGSLKNVDSSYNGFSSVILKGNTKSNIQYTKINSKTRNGSFGLKGWVSGY